jgi:hypothetical protein
MREIVRRRDGDLDTDMPTVIQAGEVSQKGVKRMLYAEEELVAPKEQVAGYPKPLLSVYLSVNPAHPENRGKAYVLRLKNTLKAVEAPRMI